eukprot:TRINITY_DN25223_c0_g1_i1.p1 TRINITY_DN25223_c0_g1~~TRINITY_DN25223_c0_g1_i1.p1  ORF type:complete len:433 (-),score=112.91 TRINITY_DN25223_c0_g1_i1:296-1594(-)
MRSSMFRLIRESQRCLRFYSSSEGIQALELDACGNSSSRSLSHEDIFRINGADAKRLPLRDYRMFFASKAKYSNGELPSILVRSGSNCYLFDMQHVKILCTSEKVVILNPDSSAVRSFTRRLLRRMEGRSQSQSQESFADIFLGADRFVAFEHVVLEAALADVMSKFNRRLELIRPILDILLNETTKNPDASMLRRLLAFRKSLSAFHTTVEQVRYAISSLLKADEDMEALYLSNKTKPGCHEEVELLLEAYDADLRELESRVNSMKTMIEETNDFINTHLNTLRNKIMRMSLFMEIGTLSAGSGALVGGILGMNLTNGFEEHPSGFLLVTGGTGIMMLSIFTTFAMKYRALQVDTSGARSYQTLKNFFAFVDDLETSMRLSENTKLDKEEFGRLLFKVVGPGVEDKEVDLIFRLFDQDKSGFIEMDEIVKK